MNKSAIFQILLFHLSNGFFLLDYSDIKFLKTFNMANICYNKEAGKLMTLII